MSPGRSASHAVSWRTTKFAGLLLLLAAGSYAPAPVSAATGIFANLSGPWGGAGTIEMSTGAKEKIRCKATYTVDGTGNNLDQSLKCASDSYKFEVQSSLRSTDSAISGSWTELTQNVNGSLSGKADSGRITAAVTGLGFSANITVVTKGDDQSVTIEPQGTDVKSVAIKLHKGSH